MDAVKRHAWICVLLIAALAWTGCASSRKSTAPTAPPPASAPDAPPPADATPSETPAAPPAAAPAVEGYDLSDPIPLDPDVTVGTLPNGVTYYVRENFEPKQRAELRLVLNAGAVLEDDDQRGLAHFIEHMAFNGTENFEKQELVDYLEGIGMRFGPDLNAYTSLDETVYMLQIPTDDDEIVAKAFQILEDWASAVTFDPLEVDKERGVVVEEWRLGRGARGRIRDKQFPVTFYGSRYADRLTIGDKDILENAPLEAFLRYYEDWYRPDLMAVVAVGDFDGAAIEAKIKEHFSRIPAREDPREREVFPIPDHEETLVSIVTDPEASNILVTVGYKRPAQDETTLGDVRESMVDNLYHVMMNARLRELTQKPDPPFLFAYAASGSLGRTKEMYRLFAATQNGGVERGVETLLLEAKRVEQYGFAATELERAKVDFLRSVDRQYEERDKQESRRFASEYAYHFLDDEPFVSIEYARDLLHAIVPGITLDEINARADQWITEENRIILVSGPDDPAAGIPDETAVLAVFDAAQRAEVTPWVDETREGPLVAAPPTPGTVVEESTIDEIGVTRWKLSNGPVVVLKPTDFKNDEILLRAFSPGGTSLVSDDQYVSASNATSLVYEMGYGEFNRIELDKALTGKVAGAGAFIGSLSEGLRGNASPQDVETMFELLYLAVTGAREDPEAYQAYLDTMRGWLANQEKSPGYRFGIKMSEVMSQGHFRSKPMTPERVGEIDLDTALAVYRDRFADVSDFVFTIVGNFEVDTIRPLVEKWIGGMPSDGREETWKDLGIVPPDGVVKFDVQSGIEPKSQVRVVFHGDAEWSVENSHQMASMNRALSIRLREVLREDLGGVYGVGAYGGISRDPRQEYTVRVSFGCNPDRVQELIDAVFVEVEALKTNGPTDEIVGKVKEAQTRKREVDLRENRFWLGQLEFHERYGLDPRDILAYDDLVDAVTAGSIQDAAQRYLDVENFIQGVLVPEETTEEAAE